MAMAEGLMGNRPTITCTPNGPYLVKDLPSLRNSRGADLPRKPVVALCRCGGSANKPFCDGTHARNGFSDARLSERAGERRDDYRGRRITVHDNRRMCAHAGYCTDGLPAVFKYGNEPWIDPDGAEVEAIIDRVHACPSGALSYSIDGVPSPAHSQPPAITVTKNGPYAVAGDIALEGDSRGQESSAGHFTLCRCGDSKNKPYCDGSHWQAAFIDEQN